MVSYNYESLCQRLRKMPAWKAAALCAACADKIAPIIAVLALPATWRVVQKSLEYCWASIAQASKSGESLKLIQALEATAEWGCDNNSFLPFVVGRGLDFIGFGLRALTSEEAHGQAEKALSLLLDLAEDFDTSAEDFPNEATVKCLSVKLRQGEEYSQERLISMLESATRPSSQFVEIIRQEAMNISGMFRTMLPVHCYCYVHDSALGENKSK